MTIRRRWVVVAATLLALTVAAVRAVLDADYRKVRETDELVERMRADKTLHLDDDIGDDIIAMVKAWRAEAGDES